MARLFPQKSSLIDISKSLHSMAVVGGVMARSWQTFPRHCPFMWGIHRSLTVSRRTNGTGPKTRQSCNAFAGTGTINTTFLFWILHGCQWILQVTVPFRLCTEIEFCHSLLSAGIVLTPWFELFFFGVYLATEADWRVARQHRTNTLSKRIFCYVSFVSQIPYISAFMCRLPIDLVCTHQTSEVAIKFPRQLWSLTMSHWIPLWGLHET